MAPRHKDLRQELQQVLTRPRTRLRPQYIQRWSHSYNSTSLHIQYSKHQHAITHAQYNNCAVELSQWLTDWNQMKKIINPSYWFYQIYQVPDTISQHDIYPINFRVLVNCSWWLEQKKHNTRTTIYNYFIANVFFHDDSHNVNSDNQVSSIVINTCQHHICYTEIRFTFTSVSMRYCKKRIIKTISIRKSPTAICYNCSQGPLLTERAQYKTPNIQQTAWLTSKLA